LATSVISSGHDHNWQQNPLAVVACAGLWIMQVLGAVGPATGGDATTTVQVLTALIGAFGGLGVTAKLDRAFKAIGTVAAVMQRLPAPMSPSPMAGHDLPTAAPGSSR
jgi:hypothetical protein